MPIAAEGVALSAWALDPLSRPILLLRKATAPVEGLRTIFSSAAAQAVAALSGAAEAVAGTVKSIPKKIARNTMPPGVKISLLDRIKLIWYLKSACCD